MLDFVEVGYHIVRYVTPQVHVATEQVDTDATQNCDVTVKLVLCERRHLFLFELMGIARRMHYYII